MTPTPPRRERTPSAPSAAALTEQALHPDPEALGREQNSTRPCWMGRGRLTGRLLGRTL